MPSLQMAFEFTTWSGLAGQGQSLRSLTDKNPFVWMLEINGILMDIRDAPREIQEFALAQGLIPYLPDDKP